MQIAVVGLGRVGLPVLAALAKNKNIVTGIDYDKNKVNMLNKYCSCGFYEPDLEETIRANRNKINFTTEISKVSSQDAVIITIGTPLNRKGIPNISYTMRKIMKIASYIKEDSTLIIKTTLPPGSTRKIGEAISGKNIYLSYCPERIVEGKAMLELEHDPKIIGGINRKSIIKAKAVIGQIGGDIIEVSSLEAAEICKLLDNTFRTVNIAYSNEICNTCEKMGIDANEVIMTVNRSYKRNNIFSPGLGADGTCLYKDCQIYTTLIQGHTKESMIYRSMTTSQSVISKIYEIANNFSVNHDIQPEISLIGLAYKGKPPTDDTRESAATKLYDILKRKYHNIKGFDPLVKQFFEVAMQDSIHSCINNSNIILLLTNHPELMDIDSAEIIRIAARPLLIIDCWGNIRNPEAIKSEKDIRLYKIGKGWVS